MLPRTKTHLLVLGAAALMSVPVLAAYAGKAPAPRSHRRRLTTHTIFLVPATVTQTTSGNQWGNLPAIKASDDSRSSVSAGTTATVTASDFTIPSFESGAVVTGVRVLQEGQQSNLHTMIYRDSSHYELANASGTLGTVELGSEPWNAIPSDSTLAVGSTTSANWGGYSFTTSSFSGIKLLFRYHFNENPQDAIFSLDSTAIEITYTTP